MSSLENISIKKYLMPVLALVFFIVYGFLFWGAPPKFNSPDETANYYFASEFAESSKLWTLEPMNVTFGPVIHPRSITVNDGRLVPGSFIGLHLIYGTIGKLISVNYIPLLTPLVTILAAFALVRVFRKIFDERIAYLGGVLFFVHPAVWYYASRGMMHNMLFVDLLIFGAFFLIARPLSKVTIKHPLASVTPYLDVVLAAVSFGLAVVVRTSEVFWLAAVGAFLAFYFIKKISYSKAAVFIVVSFLAVLPMFLMNQTLYDSPLASGYSILDNSEVLSYESVGTGGDAAEQVTSVATTVSGYLAPFGIHPRTLLRNFFNYFVEMFWWMNVLIFFGFLIFISKLRERKTSEKFGLYLSITAFVSAWLVIVYGSWVFNDNPDPTKVTIGTSYVRYWLPIFILTIPFIAHGIYRASQFFKRDWQRHTILVVIVLIISIASLRIVFFGEDGLAAAKASVTANYQIAEQVYQYVEEDAVIIVDRADKVFFPERRVMYPLRDEATYELMPRIILRAPLYYYGISFPEEDMEYLNSRRLYDMNLQIRQVAQYGDESLYWIHSRSEFTNVSE